MKLVLFITLVFFSLLSFAEVEENYLDFQISPAIVLDYETQANYSWLKPSELSNYKLSVIDLQKVASLHPGKNHLVASKLAFKSKKSFDELSHAKLNNATFISKMFSNASVKPNGTNLWKVGTKVTAYSIPFSVSFNLNFKETTLQSLNSSLRTFLKDELSPFDSTGRERVLILDMDEFSQLLYQTYAIVYIKELTNKQTVILAGVVSGFNKSSADSYFNFPPLNSTKGTVMSNMKSLIRQMITTIK